MSEEQSFSLFDAMRNVTPWDSQESANYEVAIEAVNTAVGAFSARIAAMKERADPDKEQLEKLRADLAWCARQSRLLDPHDHAQIAAARRYFTGLAKQVREDAAVDVDESWPRIGQP
jgi:hypothetical protein